MLGVSFLFYCLVVASRIFRKSRVDNVMIDKSSKFSGEADSTPEFRTKTQTVWGPPNVAYLHELSDPKLCINCKFFITDNDSGRYGKCALFSKNENNPSYLVNGESVNKDILYLCSTARNDETMCGVNATRFEPWPPEVRIMPRYQQGECRSSSKAQRFIKGTLRKIIRKVSREGLL